MKKIENIIQLRAEIKQIQSIAAQQEKLIKNDVKAIVEDLKPEKMLMNSFSSLTGIKLDKKEWFKDGIAFGLSLIFQRFIFKAEKKMENKTYDFIDNVFERVRTFLNRREKV